MSKKKKKFPNNVGSTTFLGSGVCNACIACIALGFIKILQRKSSSWECKIISTVQIESSCMQIQLREVQQERALA